MTGHLPFSPLRADTDTGSDLHRLVSELYPICRSITGDGVRETLALLKRHIDLQLTEVPSGTSVLDWTVPREWNIRDAYVKNDRGDRVVDFRASNLHVLNYSVPVRRTMTRAELAPHIFTLPDQPDLIPYRTSYYAERWGFCMSHRAFEALPDGTFDVCIDATLEAGSLTYGEYVHRGEIENEILLSAHICHPSLANDNCSGLAVLATLAKALIGRRTRHTYRFLFAPGTIGAIAWLALNRATAQRIKHGLVVSCIGDRGPPTYKRSRQGTAVIDRAMAHVLATTCPTATIADFEPYGYDERQFCSPGFDLAVGLFQRSKFGTFPEYHTSGDNLDFVTPQDLALSYDLIAEAIAIADADRSLVNTEPYGEPQLGKRGLYASIGGDPRAPQKQMALLWVLNQSDGRHSLLDIAERAKLSFADIAAAADALQTSGLLRGTATTSGLAGSA